MDVYVNDRRRRYEDAFKYFVCARNLWLREQSTRGGIFSDGALTGRGLSTAVKMTIEK